jgi:tRNA (cytidine/uridine-2'-O-)-methyltransferase
MVKYVASLFVSPHSLTCIVEINVAMLHSTPMFDVILYQPEIPPNTGNIIRLCANTGATLHLVEPLGFSLEDKQLVRAGLDYHEFATITVHESWADCAARVKGRRLFAVSTKGTQRYDLIEYAKGDAFLFGPESRGLPSEILGSVAEQQRIRVPMVPGNRSLNLSNAVAVVIYEAWRQLEFESKTRSATTDGR